MGAMLLSFPRTPGISLPYYTIKIPSGLGIWAKHSMEWEEASSKGKLQVESHSDWTSFPTHKPQYEHSSAKPPPSLTMSFSSFPCQTQWKLNNRNNGFSWLSPCSWLCQENHQNMWERIIELLLISYGKQNGHGKRENNGITVHSTMPPLCLVSASYQFTSLNRWECSCYTEQKCSLIIDIFNPLSHFSWPLVPFDCHHHLFDWLQTAHRIIIHPILQSYVYWIPSCLSSTQLSDIVLLWFLI